MSFASLIAALMLAAISPSPKARLLDPPGTFSQTGAEDYIRRAEME
jgi:hypothetical protein